MGVRVERGSTWRSSVPETILTGSYYHSNAGSGRSYDIARDGRRFLMIKETEAVDSPRNLIVVQNWDQS